MLIMLSMPDWCKIAWWQNPQPKALIFNDWLIDIASPDSPEREVLQSFPQSFEIFQYIYLDMKIPEERSMLSKRVKWECIKCAVTKTRF